MSDRPPRRVIPIKVRAIVVERQGSFCKCGCGQIVSARKSVPVTHFDHEPALRLRGVLPDGSDYDPPQHDPRYIDARCEASHRLKTSGAGATTAGTDIGKIKKMRRREKPKPSQRRKIQSQGFDKTRSRGFDGKVRPR